MVKLKVVVEDLSMIEDSSFIVEWKRGPESFTSKEMHFFTT
jgi:hypothetical protein